MSSFFSSLARKPQLDSLTSNKNEATPVFALEELADTIRKSDDRAVRDIASYLCTSRLENKSPLVKLKTLKAIKYVSCKQGCFAFRRALQEFAGNIRGAVNFRCDPDPMRGNKPAEAVREAAKEAIHAIFSSDTQQNSKRMEGFGSTSDTGISSSQKSSKSYGFGRQSFHSRGNGNSAPNAYFGRAEPVESTHISPVPLESHPRVSSKVPNVDIDQLLSDICKHKGMKVQPRDDELKAFVSSAQDVDIDVLYRGLQAKILDNAWQTSFRALNVLQALMQCPNRSFRQMIHNRVASDHSCLVEVSQKSNSNVANKAIGLLSLIGVKSSQTKKALAQQPPPQNGQGDLLDFGLEPASSAGHENGSQSLFGNGDGGTSDLFAGLDLQKGSNGTNATLSVENGNDSSMPAATKSGGGSDLFAGMDVKDGGKEPQSALDSILGTMNNSDAYQASPLDSIQGPEISKNAHSQFMANAGGPSLLSTNQPAMPDLYGMPPNPMQMMPPQMMPPQMMPPQMMPPQMMPPQMMPPQMMPQQMHAMFPGFGMGNAPNVQPAMFAPQMQTGMVGVGGGMAPTSYAPMQPNSLAPVGLGNPLTNQNVVRNSTVIEGSSRPEPAFDFVQDHLHTLKGAIKK